MSTSKTCAMPNRRPPIRALCALLPLLATLVVGSARACTQVAGISVGADCSQPAEPAPGKGRGPATSAEDELLTLINADRARDGLRAVAPDSKATRIARGHARAMSRKGRIYHNTWLATAAARRALGRPFVSENVGVGPSTGSLHVAFMNSPGHRRNVLDAGAGAVGIGVLEQDGTLWVAEVFVGGRPPARASRAGTTARPPIRKPLPESDALAAGPQPRAPRNARVPLWIALGLAAVLSARGFARARSRPR